MSIDNEFWILRVNNEMFAFGFLKNKITYDTLVESVTKYLI